MSHLALMIGLLFTCIPYFSIPTPIPISPPALVVTVRDEASAPLAQVHVTVRDTAGETVLAQTVTDAAGQAAFATLRLNTVRVTVAGRLPSGTSLTQLGEDASGVWIELGPPPTTLNLCVEASGMVLPDPATMIVREQTGIVADTNGASGDVLSAVPTAPYAATPASARTITARTTTTIPTSNGEGAMSNTSTVARTAAPSPWSWWGGLLMLGGLLVALLGVWWAQKGGRA